MTERLERLLNWLNCDTRFQNYGIFIQYKLDPENEALDIYLDRNEDGIKVYRSDEQRYLVISGLNLYERNIIEGNPRVLISRVSLKKILGY